MSTIIVTITTLFNNYLIKTIDFGDKIYDNSVITICGVLFSSLILYIGNIFNYERYNWIKFKFWYRQKNPFNFKKSWYCHDSKDTVKNKYIRTFLEKSNPIVQYLYKNILNIEENELLDDTEKTLHFDHVEKSVHVTEPIRAIYYNGKNIVYWDGAGRDKDQINISIRLYSKDAESVKEMIGNLHLKIEQENENFNKKKSIGIYEFVNCDTPLKFIGNISKKKTLDCLYYDQKDDLHKLVDKFKNGSIYPNSICIDNKLGILLYGPPGTGKTGTILAIANYLQRNIVMINFSKISRKKDLDYILNPKNYNDYIFVFDEFDCILNVLTNKKEVVDVDQNQVDWAKVLTVSNEEERKEILKMMRETLKKETDNIDIGYLLSKLDGLEDCTNRFIIATTNHPEHINPALLRPGRFDLKLCLDNCTRQMYYDILKSYFFDIEPNIIRKEVEGIKIKRWSPLEVYNIALISNDFNKTMKLIKH